MSRGTSSNAALSSSEANRQLAVSSAGFRNPRLNPAMIGNSKKHDSSISRFGAASIHPRPGSGRSSSNSVKRVVSIEYNTNQQSKRSYTTPPSVDSSVQTDDELLENIFTGIRKRSGKTASTKTNSSLCEVEYQTHGENMIDNDDDCCKPIEVTFYDIQTSKCNSEADLLLDSSKTAENNMDCSDGNLLTEEQSPLLSGAERSPLLNLDSRFMCESTSEETLSDRDDPSDDIDELLSGVHVHDGSFASIFSSELVLPGTANTSSRHGNIRKISIEYTPRHSDSSSSDFHQLSPTATSSDCTPRKFLEPRTHQQQRRLVALPTFGTDSDIPDICIHNYSPSQTAAAPSHPSSSSSSSHTSVHDDCIQSGNITGTMSMRHCCDVDETASGSQQCHADRFSGTVVMLDETSHPSSSSRHSSVDMTPSSQEEMPMSDMKTRRLDFDSVAKFQRYLRTRGLELDLSTVQSSDV